MSVVSFYLPSLAVVHLIGRSEANVGGDVNMQV